MTAELNQIYEKAVVASLAPRDEMELRALCVHESGHALVASRLGLDSDALVAGPGTGTCCHADGGPHKNAACAWGGVLAEALLRMPVLGRELPRGKPTADNLREWVAEFKAYELSDSDRDAIEACTDRHAAARAALDILSKNLDVLDYMASSLCARSRKRYAEAAAGGDVRRAEREADDFSRRFHEGRRERSAERKTDRLLADMDKAIAALPPCEVPTEFNFGTFLRATGATEADADEFVRDRARREGWGAGRAVGEREFGTAIDFFRGSQVTTRGTWIHSAREFCAWRQQAKRKEKQ